MVFGVIFAGKRYAWRKYAYVLLIVIGMAIFLYKPDGGGGKETAESGFQFGAGELLLVASLAMDGATGAIQDRIRHSYHTEKWSMMFAMNLFSSIFLAVTLTISGELKALSEFVERYPYVLNEMLLFAAAGAAGQCFIFKTVTDFGPLTCSIVTTLRKLFSLVFSIVLFAHPYTSRHVIATGVVYTALMLDALESKRAHHKHHQQLKAAKASDPGLLDEEDGVRDGKRLHTH